MIRRSRLLGTFVVLGLLTFAWLSNRWFFNPHQELNFNADAVVLMAGGRGERLERAVSIIESGTAPVLALNTGNAEWKGRAAIDLVCGEGIPGAPDAEVICFWADPDSTEGEAEAFAQLARDRGWENLILVTSTYHLHRATLRLERCFAGDVHPVAADASVSGELLHEWLGVTEALLFDRDCGLDPSGAG